MKKPKVSNPLPPVTRAWQGARLNTFLGKYVILTASLLHIGWAVLLLVDEQAGGSTPLHILLGICGGRYRTAFVLALVAVAAMAFPFVQTPISNVSVVLMLMPQQVLLLISSGAGIRAAAYGHYADGVARSGAFILADQMPMVLLSLLYIVMVLQVAAGMAARRREARELLLAGADALALQEQPLERPGDA
jgi:hypothetical protein